MKFQKKKIVTGFLVFILLLCPVLAFYTNAENESALTASSSSTYDYSSQTSSYKSSSYYDYSSQSNSKKSSDYYDNDYDDDYYYDNDYYDDDYAGTYSSYSSYKSYYDDTSSYKSKSSSSTKAGGTTSLLPGNSSKDPGEVNSQDWSKLLDLANSNVSAGVFTFSDEASTSSGGMKIFWAGVILIILALGCVGFLIYYNCILPKKKLKTAHHKPSNAVASTKIPQQQKTSSSAYSQTKSKPVAGYEDISSSSSGYSEYGDSYSSGRKTQKKTPNPPKYKYHSEKTTSASTKNKKPNLPPKDSNSKNSDFWNKFFDK